MSSCNDDSTLKHVVYSYERTPTDDVVTVLFEFRKDTSAPFGFAIPIIGSLSGPVTLLDAPAVQNTYALTVPQTNRYREHIKTKVHEMTSRDGDYSNVICGYTGDGTPFSPAPNFDENTTPTSYGLADVPELSIMVTNKGNVGKFDANKLALHTTPVYQRKLVPVVFESPTLTQDMEEYLAGKPMSISYLQIFMPNVKKGVCGFTYSVMQSIAEPSVFQAFCRTTPGSCCNTTVRMIGNINTVIPDGVVPHMTEERGFESTAELPPNEPIYVKGFVSHDKKAMLIVVPGEHDDNTTMLVFGGTWDDFVRVDI